MIRIAAHRQIAWIGSLAILLYAAPAMAQEHHDWDRSRSLLKRSAKRTAKERAARSQRPTTRPQTPRPIRIRDLRPKRQSRPTVRELPNRMPLLPRDWRARPGDSRGNDVRRRNVDQNRDRDRYRYRYRQGGGLGVRVHVYRPGRYPYWRYRYGYRPYGFRRPLFGGFGFRGDRWHFVIVLGVPVAVYDGYDRYGYWDGYHSWWDGRPANLYTWNRRPTVYRSAAYLSDLSRETCVELRLRTVQGREHLVRIDPREWGARDPGDLYAALWSELDQRGELELRDLDGSVYIFPQGTIQHIEASACY